MQVILPNSFYSYLINTSYITCKLPGTDSSGKGKGHTATGRGGPRGSS